MVEVALPWAATGILPSFLPRCGGALAAQRSLATQAWPLAGAVRVRIGLHTGEAIARGGHHVGQEIHRASRICDAGHGGQNWAFYRHYQPLVRAALGPDEARRARADGQAMTLDEAMAYALQGQNGSQP